MLVAPVAPIARKLRRDTEPKHALAGLLPLAIHCRPGLPTWNLGGPLSQANVEYITKSAAMSSSDGLPVAASFPMWLQVFTTGSIQWLTLAPYELAAVRILHSKQSTPTCSG